LLDDEQLKLENETSFSFRLSLSEKPESGEDHAETVTYKILFSNMNYKYRMMNN
jgi:hypothetical protein